MTFIYKSFNSIRQFLTCCFVSSLISDRGSLVLSLHRPNKEAAYFTGPGLDSKNNALCNNDNLRLLTLGKLKIFNIANKNMKAYNF